MGKRRKPSYDETAIVQRASSLLEAFRAQPRPWATLPELGVARKDALAAAALEYLLRSDQLVHVGQRRNQKQYAVTNGVVPTERLLSLAEVVLVERCTPGKLVLFPLATDAPIYANVPMKVKNVLPRALQRIVERREGFAQRVGRSSLVALRRNLRELLDLTATTAEASARESDGGRRAQAREAGREDGGQESGRDGGAREATRDGDGKLNPEQVVRAYRQLSEQLHSPNVVIADLQRASGVPIEQLKAWLLSECRAHRAIPMLGEPTAATAEQLAAALPVEGRPHLYVRLVQERPS